MIIILLNFIFEGQSNQVPFDDADDCTVPSTPTLFVPKRTDGFAEAIRYAFNNL